LEVKILDEDHREKDREEEGDRNMQRVCVLVNRRSGVTSAPVAEVKGVEDESDR